jgi:hypothetical protein
MHTITAENSKNVGISNTTNSDKESPSKIPILIKVILLKWKYFNQYFNKREDFLNTCNISKHKYSTKDTKDNENEGQSGNQSICFTLTATRFD